MSIRVDDREVIRAALVRAAGPNAGAATLTEAAATSWQDIGARLEPLIGHGGVVALHERCLHLRGIAAHQPAVPSADTTPFAALRCHLESRQSAEALNAAAAYFECFSVLLSSLIGAGLTARLLTPVWAEGHTETPVPENDR